jgi:hypothetical protein
MTHARLSQWFTVDVDSALVSLHRVNVDSVSDASEIHASSIFRILVSLVSSCLCIYRLLHILTCIHVLALLTSIHKTDAAGTYETSTFPTSPRCKDPRKGATLTIDFFMFCFLLCIYIYSVTCTLVCDRC